MCWLDFIDHNCSYNASNFSENCLFERQFQDTKLFAAQGTVKHTNFGVISILVTSVQGYEYLNYQDT